MRRGDIIAVTVEGLDDDARGIAAADGRTLLIDGACPGDEVSVRIAHLSPHSPVAFGTISKVRHRGSGFILPPCPHAAPVRGRCGGCPMLHLALPLRAEVKAGRVRRALAAVGCEVDCAYHEAKAALGYRNRAHFIPVRRGRHRVVLGSYAPRTHDVVPMQGCLAVRPAIAEVAAAVERQLAEWNVPLFPWDESLRYVSLRAGTQGEVLIELVTTTEQPSWLAPFSEALLAVPKVVGICASCNDQPGDAIHLCDARPLAGQVTVTEVIGPLVLAVPVAAFTQLNSEVAAAMYAQAASWLPARGVLHDLYCGQGGLSLTAAMTHEGQEVFGADATARAIAHARFAAWQLGVTATYETVDLSLTVPTNWPRPAAVIVNPPRRGLDAPVRAALAADGPPLLVYMSCNPESFARDLAVLTPAGYRLAALAAYDMLPGTLHIELLGHLVREA